MRGVSFEPEIRYSGEGLFLGLWASGHCELTAAFPMDRTLKTQRPRMRLGGLALRDSLARAYVVVQDSFVNDELPTPPTRHTIQNFIWPVGWKCGR